MNHLHQQQFQPNYGSIQCWPTPFMYNQWYLKLPLQYKSQYYYPQQYTLFYEQTCSKLKSDKKPKLSRCQKRKQKKQQLKQQLQQEEKKIGNWVKLQRKDLFDSLKKIQEQQEKLKKKKSQKLSHLIQIHKQIYKLRCKRGTLVVKCKPKSAKKKPSHFKKMRQIYLQNIKKTRKQKLQKSNDQQYLTVSQQSQEEVKQQKIEKNAKKINEITYKKIGKLTGKEHNGYYLRQWVNNMPSNQLEDITLRLINRLAYKQAVKQINKPQKARKIIVSGIHQCRRTLRTIIDRKKCRILIVALNIEKNNLQRGIDDEMQKLIEQAELKEIVIAHVSTRKHLGRAFTGKFGPKVSVISIINFQGYQDMVEQLMVNLKVAKQQYNMIDI